MNGNGTERAELWSQTPSRRAWYALHLRSRHEKLVERLLTQKGEECFLPTYASRRCWSDRVTEMELPLFRGYIFCRLDPQCLLPVISTPGVVRVVGAGNRPIPVRDEEIDALRSLTASRFPVEPWPYTEIGQWVRILYGPLRGVEGVLLAFKGRDRLVVNVTLLQRACAVEIDRGWAEPV